MPEKKHDERIAKLLQPPTNQPISTPVEISLADYAMQVVKKFRKRGWTLPGGFGTAAESCTLEFHRHGSAKKVIRLKASDIGTRSPDDIVNKYLGPKKDDE